MKNSVGKPKNLCDKDNTSIFSTHAAVFVQKELMLRSKNTDQIPWRRVLYPERSVQQHPLEKKQRWAAGNHEGQGAERQQTTICCYFYHCLGQTTWNSLATPLSSLWVKSCHCVEPEEHFCATTSKAAAISLSTSGSVLIVKTSHNKGLKQSAR